MTDVQTTTDQTATGQGGDAEAPETNRARVRRLLIAPAQARGMRFPARMPEDDQRRMLDGLCDELAYLGDDALRALCEWAISHGDGSSRAFWPPRVSLISTAEAFQPRPLEETPSVASWFASRAGEAALAGDRLVAEFLWFEKKKRPPQSDLERARIATRAQDLRRDIELIASRKDRGVADETDHGKLAWYRRLETRARALVNTGIAKRSATEGDSA